MSNREIKFRGLYNGTLVYGNLIKGTFDGKKFYQIEQSDSDDFGQWTVDIESVGQFIGLKDKAGNDIYEGDKFEGDEPLEYVLVEYNESEARFQVNYYGFHVSHGEGSQEIYASEISRIDENVFDISALTDMLIIGNIHEHPNLIGQ